jgi:hypothetical protein
MASIPLVVSLKVSGLEVAFAAPPFLFVGGAGADSAVSAVVADAVHRNVIDNGLVVDVNVGDGHVVYGPVVIEVAVSPIATFITVPKVAESVVHAAVEADMRSPVARVPHIHAIAPSPVSRGPE